MRLKYKLVFPTTNCNLKLKQSKTFVHFIYIQNKIKYKHVQFKT